MLTGRALLEEKDLVIIGGGVAGYVAAIKAGQEGLKVRMKKKIEAFLFSALDSGYPETNLFLRIGCVH